MSKLKNLWVDDELFEETKVQFVLREPKKKLNATNVAEEAMRFYNKNGPSTRNQE